MSKLLGVNCVELDVGRTHVHLGERLLFRESNLIVEICLQRFSSVVSAVDRKTNFVTSC